MSTHLPLASVVIPTHNRRDRLCRTLAALARQSCPPERFEIVVSANACSDGTGESVRGLMMPCGVRIVELPEPNAAAARNAGARAACGTLLIFLDDDIEVSPDFVSAHLEAHNLEDGVPQDGLPLRVAVGYIPATLQPEADFFAIALRGWWEAMFDRMRDPGHRFAYSDLLTGNFSLPRESFTKIGGFDERYACHEDYEIGYRLVVAGARFVFAERAWGYHTDLTRLARACARKRDEGRADVLLANQYPPLRPALLLSRRRSRKQQLIRRIVFIAPGAGDRIAGLLARFLPLLEHVGARASWSRVLYGIFGYWYERGVADQANSFAAVRSLIPDADAEPEPAGGGVPLDVTDLDAAERRLDEERPEAVTLCVGSRAFGELPATPGAERLAGRHLRPALTRLLYREYVRALIGENRFPLFTTTGTAVSAAASTAGRVDPIGLLSETAPPRSAR